MAQKKISELTAVVLASGSAVLPIVQDGTTSKITFANLTGSILNVATAVTASHALTALSALTASYALNANIETGQFAVTGSNTFIGNQIIVGTVTATTFTGSFIGDGSGLTNIPGVSGSVLATGSFATTGSNTFVGSQIIGGNVFADNYKGYYSLVGTASSEVITFNVLSINKTSNHRYFGTGSAVGYHIDGVEAPFLTLLPGKTYRFNQSDASNNSHQLRFYYQADKTTLYTTNVTHNGTAGQSGAYTQIVVTDTTPTVLHYQCVNHGYMGNSAQFNSNVIDTPYLINAKSGITVTGTVTATTFTGSFTGNGSGLTEVTATSASHALNANTATSASFAISASFATTASYAVNALTASYAPPSLVPLKGSANLGVDIIDYYSDPSTLKRDNLVIHHSPVEIEIPLASNFTLGTVVEFDIYIPTGSYFVLRTKNSSGNTTAGFMIQGEKGFNQVDFNPQFNDWFGTYKQFGYPGFFNSYNSSFSDILGDSHHNGPALLRLVALSTSYDSASPVTPASNLFANLWAVRFISRMPMSNSHGTNLAVEIVAALPYSGNSVVGDLVIFNAGSGNKLHFYNGTGWDQL